MSRDLLDEISYLQNFEDFLDLVEEIYRNANIYEVLESHRLIVVGGQALSFWYARFLIEEKRFDEFQSAYSEDLDFFGVKSSVEFCENRLDLPFQRPQNFESTVNLAMATCNIGNPPREVIIDILHEVGGLERAEVINGVELLPIRGIEVPVINPILCLRSRINNFYATYKADKLNENMRIKLCIRLVHAYLVEILDSEGWNSVVSGHFQAVFSICLSDQGRRLFCKNGIDLLRSLPMNHENLHSSFVEKQLPRQLVRIESERKRMHEHLLRFDALYDGTITDLP